MDLINHPFQSTTSSGQKIIFELILLIYLNCIVVFVLQVIPIIEYFFQLQVPLFFSVLLPLFFSVLLLLFFYVLIQIF